MTRKQFLTSCVTPGSFASAAMSEDAGNIQIDAPKGYVFMATGTHTMVEPFRNHGGQSWKPQAHADIVNLLELGLTECDDDDCDVCEERS